MFLTKFDKKMYEEALRQEGREELEEKIAELSKNHAELSKNHAELSKNHAELSKNHAELSKNYAKRMFEKGVPYDVAQSVITEIREEELKEIYGLK